MKFDFNKIAITFLLFLAALPSSFLGNPATAYAPESEVVYQELPPATIEPFATETPVLELTPGPDTTATPTATPVAEVAAPVEIDASIESADIEVASASFDFGRLLEAVKYALAIFKGMVFFSILAQLFLSFLKQRKIIPDNKATPVLVGLQILLIGAMSIVHYVSPEFDLAILDTYMKSVIDSWGTLVPILVMVSTWWAKFFYDNALKGVPLIGFSNSISQKTAKPAPVPVK